MESLCIRYGNGWGRILKIGDKVMLEDGIRDLYPKIPKEVSEGVFEIVGFTK